MSQFITPQELRTHAYDEEIKAIIREDETIALASIDMAIEFAESKLMKDYDTAEIFAKRSDARSPLLVKIIKDIAIWELIGLANPSIDYDDKKLRYEDAKGWLTAVYKGMPTSLPRKETKEASSFKYTSNPKRENYY
ncbi:hypothetical protein HZR02_17675 [Elizabethkingia anophelis]|uniref:DUF1320 domain-containing protein n=1 Tax=Elizabethkingia anophelis TaxID=1117645 RepID=UPI0021A86397|nr:DUF1320 domain-containing protein [Elizabethkingia anophelis]MCT3645710.1 hypothetical protein [Elizabethkingia anophelis]MCT3653586.1 hypothetical protein [Elizabethkingia anophelis]MCT3660716.1 hypothetical protein [Elizabethkingia anophelis]MCT3667882.1 hypothetical protein [Elizabethkingia anophelis]MCT3678608.1 hypothetical protein [Elizabethkingia anophelis]